MLVVYYGKDDVLGSHPIEYIIMTVFIVGLFTADMVVKSWFTGIPKITRIHERKCSTGERLESVE